MDECPKRPGNRNFQFFGKSSASEKAVDAKNVGVDSPSQFEFRFLGLDAPILFWYRIGPFPGTGLGEESLLSRVKKAVFPHFWGSVQLTKKTKTSLSYPDLTVQMPVYMLGGSCF